MADLKTHWDNLYAERRPGAVSWFLAEPKQSLVLIAKAGLAPAAKVVDMGSGASVLVDHLVDLGYQVTAVDLSSKALDESKKRLAEKANAVTWIAADACAWKPGTTYDLWHDRAVFHFMTESEQRAGYLAGLRAGLKKGGYLVLAAFALDGPAKCSGLTVKGYDAELLLETLGPDFRLLDEVAELHQTPWNTTQKFTYHLIRREA